MKKYLITIPLICCLFLGLSLNAQAAEDKEAVAKSLAMLSSNIVQAINDNHYDTAESLLQAFQSKWKQKGLVLSPNYRENEALQVVMFDLKKALQDPSHSPLIHDGKAFYLVVETILTSEKADLSSVKDQLLPSLDTAKHELKKSVEEFTPAFNEWTLNFSAYEPLFYLVKTDNIYHPVISDIKEIGTLQEEGASQATLLKKVDLLESDLYPLLVSSTSNQELPSWLSHYHLLIYSFSVVVTFVIIITLYRVKRKRPQIY